MKYAALPLTIVWVYSVIHAPLCCGSIHYVFASLRWTPNNAIERYNARWMVRGFLEIRMCTAMDTHVQTASDTSRMLLQSLVVRHDLHLNQPHVKTTFLNSPLAHAVWVRFLPPTSTPLGTPLRSCTNPSMTSGRRSLTGMLCGLRMVYFDLALSRPMTDPCFRYNV